MALAAAPALAAATVFAAGLAAPAVLTSAGLAVPAVLAARLAPLAPADLGVGNPTGEGCLGRGQVHR